MQQAWEVNALLTEGLASGEVVPLPLNIFQQDAAADAFRFMGAGAHCIHSLDSLDFPRALHLEWRV